MEDNHDTLTNANITADIIAAYVANNTVAASDLAKLIGEVHATLQRLAKGEPEPEPAEARQVMAVSIKKSVTPDHIVCLEDGKKFKSLKRHLASAHGMTPAAYRAKWGLPDDYPIVAPVYAAQRSRLAKAAGLGQARKAARLTKRPQKK